MSALDQKIIGSSEHANNLKKMIELVAGSNSSVIINGPTGSGKELVAEAIHNESRRKGKFIALNCAAIPAELIEAELFGFEKGAFTGASQKTIGKFESANRGTIFLDEIGDMPHTLQTKLLRVLENSTISRVGGNADIPLNLRIICATHKNLQQLISENKFREDLYFRLNVFTVEVPPLNERTEDIPELVRHFISQKKSSSGARNFKFSDDAYTALKEYHWPGNIREIRNVIERAITFFPSQKVNGQDVIKYLLKQNPEIIRRTEEQEFVWQKFDEIHANKTVEAELIHESKPPSASDFSQWFEHNNSVNLRALLRDIEIVLITAAMERNNNNTSEAAKDLKLLRTTLIEKIKKYGI